MRKSLVYRLREELQTESGGAVRKQNLTQLKIARLACAGGLPFPIASAISPTYSAEKKSAVAVTTRMVKRARGATASSAHATSTPFCSGKSCSSVKGSPGTGIFPAKFSQIQANK